MLVHPLSDIIILITYPKKNASDKQIWNHGNIKICYTWVCVPFRTRRITMHKAQQEALKIGSKDQVNFLTSVMLKCV